MARSLSAARSVYAFLPSHFPRLSPELPPWSHACPDPCRPLIRFTASLFSDQAGSAQAAVPEEKPPYPSVPGKDIPALLEAGGSYLDVR